MIWVLIVVVAVLLVAAFLAMLAGRLPYDGLSEPVHTTPRIDLPADLDADDIAALQFDTALRGYRMDQVDAVLRTLKNRVAALEDEVARSRDLEPARSAHLEPAPAPLEPARATLGHARTDSAPTDPDATPTRPHPQG